jgi:positive regulator of sigma E activity
MTASGVVSRRANGRVEVEFATPAACRGCEGLCLWRRLPRVARAELATALPLRVGDPVVVALPQRFLLIGTLFVHGLPLVALLGGALLGVAATGSDLGCLAGAAAGLGFAAAATPRMRRRLEQVTLGAISVAPSRSQ